MSAAPITRRALARAAGAVLGAAALPAGAITIAAAGTLPSPAAGAVRPDAELFGLLSRHAQVLAVAKAAGVDLDAAEEITDAAWDAKPEALWRGSRDPHLGLGPSSDPTQLGSPRRFYTVDDVEQMANELAARGQHDLTPYQIERDARRREIMAAHAAWKGEVDRVIAATGWEALSDRFDAAWDAVLAIERTIAATPASTLAGLCAKAALVVQVADRRGVDKVPLDLARELAAFQVQA